MSARSDSRARAARSSPSSRTSRSHHGVSTSATPPSMTTAAMIDCASVAVSTPSPEASPTNSSTPTPASRIPPATRSTLTGVRPPARSCRRPRCAASSWLHASHRPASTISAGSSQSACDVRAGPDRDRAATAATTSTAPMAMSVTGMRRPGSMIACRRASRVSALGRTSCAASAGSPAGIASHQNTYSTRPTPATGVEHDEREPHQADRHVEVRGEPERDAAEPAARARVGAAAAGGGAASGRGGVHGPIVTCPEPSRGRRPGSVQGRRRTRFRVRSGDHPMPRARRDRPGSRHGHDAPRPAAGPDPAPGTPRRPPATTRRPDRAEQLLRRASAASASRAPTTAGSAASARASATGSASTRCWCAASSSRRCCSAGSASSRTASPGRCCPSVATVASTSRR